MSPINHGAAALVIKSKWPDAPLWPLLIAVQLFDLAWIAFNVAGLERTTTETDVRAINDIHFVFMPLSHSIATTLIVAAAAWLVCARVLAKPRLGIALAAAIASHLVLDVAVHLPDIAIAPFVDLGRIGSGLYGVPVAAFVSECIFAIACWYVYRGRLRLLIGILTINILSVTLFVPEWRGPETLFGDAPLLFVGFVSIGVVGSTLLLGWLATPESPR